ncbi:MAG: ThuA domain-containing protein [Chitinophagaceae bacterium]|nr:ThuA domain-containing protein [Chitinophagaceae bacterium]
MSKILLILLFYLVNFSLCAQYKQWVEYKAAPSDAKNKHIVLVSGDEEYRSEEALPMLAQILAKQHGFDCTVLFAIDPATGAIDPNNVSNIPGLEKLESADLMIIFTRFRELPDEQMAHIDNYLKKGKPVIGIRTATHAFHYEKNPGDRFAHYDWQSKKDGWEKGFGKRVLGETWISHHGDHGKEGTRALINGVLQNAKHPVLNNVKDIWCPTDVYAVDHLPGDPQVLVYGQPTKGMTSSSPLNLKKSIMPVVWTKTYEIEQGRKGRALTSTMGAAVDLQNEDLRRMFVNACYWLLDLKVPDNANVNFVTPYKPTMFGFDGFIKGIFPEKYEIK